MRPTQSLPLVASEVKGLIPDTHPRNYLQVTAVQGCTLCSPHAPPRAHTQPSGHPRVQGSAALADLQITAPRVAAAPLSVSRLDCSRGAGVCARPLR